MKRIAIFIDYFGKRPEWLELFLESCRTNPTIDWYIHTDIESLTTAPPNIKITYSAFNNYCNFVSAKLDITFFPQSAYNICNVRPMTGVLYAETIAKYDYYGWGDLDVIYGDIRSIYNDHVLTYNVISTHAYTCSGHLTLVRNLPWLRTAFLSLRGWKERLQNPGPVEWKDCLDEAGLTALFSPFPEVRGHYSSRFAPDGVDARFHSNNYFQEQWSTPFTPGIWLDGKDRHPEHWIWRNGVLTNKNDGNRSFLYLHFMNLKNKRWIDMAKYSNSPTWQELPKCVNFTMDQFWAIEASRRAIRIDRYGFHLLDESICD